MENKLIIQTSGIVLPVERDGKEVGSIRFNPADVSFARRYFTLIDSFEQKTEEFVSKASEIDKDNSRNKFGIPSKETRGVALLAEICDYMKQEIDSLFGSGTSEIVFGDVCSIAVFQQFFSGITDYINEARAEKIAQYAVRKE